MAIMLDISVRAGISKVTVSCVLDGAGQVRESTRRPAFKAMEELGYRPNFLARSLANQTSNSIGLVVSTSDGFYLGRLLQQVSHQTEARGEQLIVTDGHDTPECEEEAVQMLADRQYDAIILYTRHMDGKAITSLVNSIAMPLVVTNRDMAQTRERCMFFKQQKTTFQTVKYLITQSYCNIACMTIPVHIPTGRAHLQGYRDALIKYGIEWNSSQVKYGDSAMTRGYELCQELLDEEARFSVLSFYSGDMALGALKALHQAGLRIPQDVSLFGFDGTPSAKWLESRLSMVYLPIDSMITMAIDQAIKLINQRPIETVPPFISMLMLCESVMTGPSLK